MKVNQIINTVNDLEKKEINVDNHKENKKEFIENKLLLISQQRFNVIKEKRNVFTEEINKIALSPNDDKRIQSIDICAWNQQRSHMKERRE